MSKNLLENFKLLNGEISVIKVLMLFYLLITMNIMSKNINNKIETIIKDNIYLKHLLGLITVMILLSLIYNLTSTDLILYSIILYFVFLLSTKISSKYVIVLLLILAVIYFYDYFNEKKIKEIQIDTILNKNEKNNIIENKKINSRNVTIGTIFVILCCSLLYENKKINQFGGDFELNKFLN